MLIRVCFHVCADVREVFDLFDFWDGRDGLVDGAKIGDVMRCIGLNPTNKQILDNGGTKKFGAYHGVSWSIMGYQGVSWGIMEYHRVSWSIMGYHGVS